MEKATHYIVWYFYEGTGLDMKDFDNIEEAVLFLGGCKNSGGEASLYKAVEIGLNESVCELPQAYAIASGKQPRGKRVEAN